MRSIDELKFCIKCHVMKPITDFVFINRARGRRQSWCRPCDAQYKRAWYAKNRERHIGKVRVGRVRLAAENQARTWAYLAEHPCVDCGETDPIVLEFDHVRDKARNVSTMARGWTWLRIAEEIAKCEVRCANCHRRKTAKERGYYERKRKLGLAEEAALYAFKRHNLRWAVSSVDRAALF